MPSLAEKPRTGLDKATIVQVALDLLDAVGIEGLSTRRLALELGVKGPSLYWHFHSKAELLEQMSSALFAEAVPAPDFETANFDWVEWLAEGARGIRRVALSRRDGAIVMARARPIYPEETRGSAEVVRCLALHSGLSERDSRLTLFALGRFAMGWVLYEQAAARETADGGDAGFEFGLQTALMGVKARVAALKG